MEELVAEAWSFSKSFDKTASGSAYLESQSHKILATVNGPKEYYELSSSEEYVRHSQATLQIESAHSQFIKSAFGSTILVDRYPKAVIEIKIQIIEGKESTALPLMINAATLSLLDAGIEMRDTLIACSAARNGEKIVINQEGSPQVIVGYLVNTDEIVMLQETGGIDQERLAELLRASIDSCKTFFNYLQNNFN
ncbi:unnamed protein product [Blepharisma stoltei]|uniref:Exoribonuclease phosphorolytic domain-containing protein n=1 Tax=Blepharisma stoltei TaxID=1481888 RepID=A0AAU9INP3_9CILI|nr:unnamed protein product [Blepharisma stoltei]